MILPNLISNRKSQIANLKKGFTLVELLVVIAVLGVLAAGLLATIDPLEQFRKAADANKRSSALELVNAVNRYYAGKQAMPWDAVGGVAACDTAFTEGTAIQVSAAAAASAFDPCLTELTAQGELKSTFATQYGILSSIWLTETTAAGSSTRTVAACFDPQSKSMSRATTTIYTQAGANTCVPSDANLLCYYCAQ